MQALATEDISGDRPMRGLLFLVAILCALTGACGSGNDADGSGVVKILAPAHESFAQGSPVTIAVAGADVKSWTGTTVLLNGFDISKKLGQPDANGVRTATVVAGEVHYGKNQIQIRNKDGHVNSNFLFDPVARTRAYRKDATGPDSLLVPVKTRVLQNGDPTIATNWGIQVGDTVYRSNVPVVSTGGPCSGQSFCNQGFQVLLVHRQDLSLVSNNSYIVASAVDIAASSPLSTALRNAATGVPSGCENGGCVLLIQSLSLMGYTPCHGTNYGCNNPSADVDAMLSLLQNLGATGASLYANGLSANVAYSFIGNAGSGNNQNPVGGTQYERLGCSDTTFGTNGTICDSLNYFGSSLNSPPDPTQIGAISGVLIRDNYNNFTYSPSARQIHYTFGTSAVGGVLTNVVSIDGSTTEGVGQYSMSLPQGSTGGFRLLILNRDDPSAASCASCSSGSKRFDQFFDTQHLQDLINQLNGYNDGNGLFFLASMGNISHTDTDGAQVWEALTQVVARVGGHPLTFRILGLTYPPFNPDSRDDYLLVGRQNSVYLNMARFQGAEAGYSIRRHTTQNATSPTSVEGVLAMDQQGYYAPRLQGQAQDIISPQITALAGASLLSSTGWPFMSTVGEQSAYAWISDQLCCDDIRAAYVNLNNAPSNWLDDLAFLSFPTGQTGFSETDFNNVRNQLHIEFEYVVLVQTFRANVEALYPSQQSQLALILQQAEDDVLADIYQGGSVPRPVQASPWRAFTTDVFPILSDMAGFLPAGSSAIKTSLGISTLVINTAVDKSNDQSGNSQLMLSLANQEVAAADLAKHVVDQYTDSLVSLGNQFDRVVTDWARLSTLGKPLRANQVPWDATASGYLLRGFDLAARRQYYPALMAANPSFFVVHIQYGDDHYYGSDDDYAYGNNEGCDISDFHEAQDHPEQHTDMKGTAWYPGVIQSSGARNPNNYWWDIWALGLSPNTNDHCPKPDDGQLANTFGMFDPANQNDTSALGLWKPYFFTNWGGTRYNHENDWFSTKP